VKHSSVAFLTTSPDGDGLSGIKEKKGRKNDREKFPGEKVAKH